MAVKLRLVRVGKKKSPAFRIVAADSRSPRNGRFIEIVGQYYPLKDPSEINLQVDKVQKWLGNGAIPTDRVRVILEKEGLLTKSQRGKK